MGLRGDSVDVVDGSVRIGIVVRKVFVKMCDVMHDSRAACSSGQLTFDAPQASLSCLWLLLCTFALIQKASSLN